MIFSLIFFFIFLTIIIILTFFKFRRILLLILFPFLLRILFILLDYYYPIIPYNFDELQFIATSKAIYDRLILFNFYFEDLYSQSQSVFYFSFFNAIIYLFFGVSELISKFFNAFLFTLFSLKLYQLSNLFTSSKNSRNIVLITSYLPSFFLISVLYMRDMFVAYLFVNVFYFFILYLRNSKISDLFAFSFYSFLSSFLRQLNPLLILFSVASFLVLKFILRLKIQKSIYIPIMITTLFFIMIFFLNFTTFGNSIVEYIIREHNYRSTGGSVYINARFYDLSDILLYSLPKYIYFLFYPFIFNINSPQTLLVFFESSFYLVIFIYVLFKIFKILRSTFLKKRNLLDSHLFLLSFFFVVSFVGSTITANGGTASRQRTFFIYILIILYYLYKDFSKATHSQSKLLIKK
jgi:hypothetical protein